LQAFFLKKLRWTISPKLINGLRSKRSRKALLLRLVLVVIDIKHGTVHTGHIVHILHTDNISHIVLISHIGILGVFISVGENLSPTFQ
jgi:hypothetical protein